MAIDRGRRYTSGIAIALAFFVVSLFNLRDYGLTDDETESYQAAGLYLNILKTAAAGQPTPSWSLHQLPGYYLVVDVLRSGFTRLLSRETRLMDWVLAFHLFHVFLSTLALFLVYAPAYEVSGRRRIATLTSLSLAFLPQFVAHSQNNPKDLPGLLLLILAAFLFTRLHAASPIRDVVYAALALGVALTTHVSSVLLVPMFGIWQLVSGRKLRFQSYVWFGAVAGATAFLCWPWLWSAPLHRMAGAVEHVRGRFGFPSFPVLYFGSVYEAWGLPWHYLLVSLLISTAATSVCVVVAFGFVAAQLISIHPYQNAYLNEITTAWISDPAEDTFEIEYWAQSYKEGVQWIERNAEPDAALYIALADEVAVHYFTRRYEYFDEERFADSTRPAYLMVMTRKAWYTPARARVARDYTPVFAIRRQKGTLLAVYSNRSGASRSAHVQRQ